MPQRLGLTAQETVLLDLLLRLDLDVGQSLAKIDSMPPASTLELARKNTVLTRLMRLCETGAEGSRVPVGRLDDPGRLHRMMLRAELCQLLDALHEAQIPVLPLKGPVLADCYYGAPVYERPNIPLPDQMLGSVWRVQIHRAVRKPCAQCRGVCRSRRFVNGIESCFRTIGSSDSGWALA